MTAAPLTSQTADAHTWAARIRASRPDLYGARCGNPADEYDSSFRRWAMLRPAHLCQLRELARRQAADRRQGADTAQEPS